jgi:hypothetical protein
LARQSASGKVSDRLERAGAEVHARAAAFFRAARGAHIVHLDAARPADEVEAAAWEVLAARLEKQTAAGRVQ